MAPGHVRGINGKTPSSVGGVCPLDADSRHFPAKTVVENMAHATLRKTAPTSRIRRWQARIQVELWVTLPRSAWIVDQRLVQTGIALESGPPGPVPVRKSNRRIRVTHRKRVDQRGRDRMGEGGDQISTWPNETILNRGEGITRDTPLRCQHGRIPRVVNVAKRQLHLGVQLLINVK